MVAAPVNVVIVADDAVKVGGPVLVGGEIIGSWVSPGAFLGQNLVGGVAAGVGGHHQGGVEHAKPHVWGKPTRADWPATRQNDQPCSSV